MEQSHINQLTNLLIDLSGMVERFEQALDKRRPVSVTNSDGFLSVVCSDGACFRENADGHWEQEPPIPGTPADRRKDEA